MKILIDTNIIVDIYQKRENFFEASYETIKMAMSKKCELCLSSKSILDIYYLMHKHLHSDEETRKIIIRTLSLFSILNTTDEDCKNALFSEIGDYEDAVMTEIAKREKCDLIVTRNVKDFIGSKIKVITPNDFLKID